MILRVFCGVLVFLCVLMLLQWSGIEFILYCFPTTNAVVFNNSNHFGYVLCIGIAIAAGAFTCDKDSSKLYKTVFLLLVALFTFVLLINATFGA